MRLRDFGPAANFGSFNDFEIEDVSFFYSTIMTRMIEDAAIVIYVHAKQKGANSIEENLAEDVLHFLDPTALSSCKNAPVTAVVRPSVVGDFARLPIQYTAEATNLLSRFLNFYLIEMLKEAAGAAEKENLKKIKLHHILSVCEKWLWPFNRWC